MSPLVSIIVPVFNVEKYLNRCIFSIVNQSYEHIEIIIIDDGSNDSSSSICDEWSKKDGRIKVIHQENQGLSSARNTGISCISGKYFIAVDSDDYLYLNAIEYLVKAIEETSSDVAMFKFHYSFNKKHPLKFPKSKTPLKYYSKEDWDISSQIFKKRDYQTFFWNKMWRVEVFKNKRFDEKLRCYEDIDILPSLLSECKKGVFLKNHLLKYFLHNDSLCHKSCKLKEKLDLLIKVCNKCEDFYLNSTPELSNEVRHWWALEYIYISNDRVPFHLRKEKRKIFFEEGLLNNYKKHSKGFLFSHYTLIHKYLYIRLNVKIFLYELTR